MAESTIDIKTFLHNFHAVREEGHSDLAFGSYAGNEGRNIAFDGSFANRFAKVWITAARHPLAIELHLQFVVAEREHAKVVTAIFVNAVNLSRSYNAARRLRGARLCARPKLERESKADDGKKFLH